MAALSRIVDFQSRGSKRSDVWLNFGFPEEDGKANKTKVVCKICRRHYPYSGNTTNMRCHLDRKHWSIVRPEPTVRPEPRHAVTSTTTTVSTPPLPSMSLYSSIIPQATITGLFTKQQPLGINTTRATDITQGIADFIVMDMKPLNTVEGKGFKKLMKVVEPRYNVVSRNHLLERYVVPMYHTTKEEVKSEIQKGIRHAFTTDGWTSINSESFITTTVHYIDPEPFVLCSKVLDTKCVHYSHTSENLASEMKGCIASWKLADPIAVTDNAANVVNACNVAEIPHLGCFGHTLNLAVNRCLSVSEVQALLGKCRKLVSVFKQSSLKTTALHAAQVTLDMKELQMLQDVDTRWNSALLMLTRLLDIFPAIWATLYKDKKYSHLLPSDSERKNMEDLKDLLAPVEVATVRVSSEKSATASLILPMIERFVKYDFIVKEGDSKFIMKAKDAIRTDLLKRYQKDEERKLLTMATVLDPRFQKLQWLDDPEREQVYSQLALEIMNDPYHPDTAVSIKSETVCIKTEPVEASAATDVHFPPIPDVTVLPNKEVEVPVKKSKLIEEPNDDFFDVLFVKEERGSLNKQDIVKMETDRYRSVSVTMKQDPIEWWRCNGQTYPYMARQAAKYLHIPATNVPSERVFSTAGNILNKKRGTLKSDNVDLLIFLYHNYNK